MIDTTTGRLLLDGIHAITPTLTLAAFQASPLARGGQSIGVAAAWRGFFVGRHAIFGDPCTVTLQFHGQRLQAVSFVVVDPVPPSSSEEWSIDEALATKARQDAWLAAKVGPPPYAYAWGVIESVYDPRSVSSSIFVRYA
jgi:hypothetical protein